jgi:hypothetical protein
MEALRPRYKRVIYCEEYKSLTQRVIILKAGLYIILDERERIEV